MTIFKKDITKENNFFSNINNLSNEVSFSIGYSLLENVNFKNDNFILSIKNNKKEIIKIFYNKTSNMVDIHFYTDCCETEPFILSHYVKSNLTDYVLTYEEHILSLYNNGILFDEEWPFGKIDISNLNIHCNENLINKIFIQPKAIKTKYFENLYTKNELEASKKELIPSTQSTMQYFCPPGYNTFAGDCIPFYYNGTYHLYYLFDRRHHRSKKGYGAHQWAHSSTKDFIHWDHHPIALGITDVGEGSICTGSIIYKDGLYYAFYSNRDINDGCEKITYATGNTPNNFLKTNTTIFTFPTPPYVPGPGRDPFVFKGEDDNYYMFVTARVEDEFNGSKGGCLTRLFSKDLIKWELLTPYLPGYIGDPECADYFKINDWYYLIFSNEGVAKYRMSKNPQGPWLHPKVDTFDSPCYRVFKTAPFGDSRRIGAAFLEKKFGEFGGNIIFREIKQDSDGNLFTTFVDELNYKSTGTISPTFEATDNVITNDTKITIENMSGFSSARCINIPKNIRLKTNIAVEPDSAFIGIAFNGKNTYEDCHEVKFNLIENTAEIRNSSHGYFSENNKQKITSLELEDNFSLEIVLWEDICDVYIDNKRTLLGRVHIPQEKNLLYFYGHEASVIFDDITIETLS
ncbi:MAG: hypothetical protein ACK5LT_01580 [Lachnospirales bacterium]